MIYLNIFKYFLEHKFEHSLFNVRLCKICTFDFVSLPKKHANVSQNAPTSPTHSSILHNAYKPHTVTPVSMVATARQPTENLQHFIRY